MLTRLDVAFSRDQPEKIYVQHKLLARAAEVYQWLQRGAHLYLCGDADPMAKDVHNALAQIIATQAELSAEDAEEYLQNLRSDKRYHRDVY